jgi:hypothetical protein
MFRPLLKYDYTAFSIPQPSEEIHPRYTKLIRTLSPAILPPESIFSIQLKSILAGYAGQAPAVPLAECRAWQFIANQIRNHDREMEIVPYHDDARTRDLVEHLHRVYKSVDAARPVPVTDVRKTETPWTVSQQASRLYYFDWERTGKSIPMLLDFFHAVVQFNVMYYQCNDYRQVRRSVDQALAHKEYQAVVEKFAIDAELHLKIYLLFATSYYLRIYVENYFPRDILHRFIAVWHEGLMAIE